MRSNRFIGVAAVPVRLIALALLTRMSIPPSVPPSSDRCRDAASSRMSQAIGNRAARLVDRRGGGMNGPGSFG
jgi:hypothetical protein